MGEKRKNLLHGEVGSSISSESRRYFAEGMVESVAVEELGNDVYPEPALVFQIAVGVLDVLHVRAPRIPVDVFAGILKETPRFEIPQFDHEFPAVFHEVVRFDFPRHIVVDSRLAIEDNCLYRPASY